MSSWPKLEYSADKSTIETLHRWLQIVGKLRLCKAPLTNHSWNTTLYVTSRGLTTSAIPMGDFTLTVDFDFFDHQLNFFDSLGRTHTIKLKNESVAEFYERFKDALKIFEIAASFEESPNEVAEAIPFYKDTTHKTYSPQCAHQLFQAFVRANNVLLEWRADFVGKSSPVHFFWGSFDLACTRFSGRRAPEHPGGIPHLSDAVVREAYSHEVMSVGFWPGNELFPEAAFYAYAYPEPEGFARSKIMPPEAFYHQDMHEFVLPYEKVRTAVNPAATVKAFFDSCYRASANLGSWDRDILEVSPYLMKLREIGRSSFGEQAIRQ
jgi:hypothetical protein